MFLSFKDVSNLLNIFNELFNFPFHVSKTLDPNIQMTKLEQSIDFSLLPSSASTLTSTLQEQNYSTLTITQKKEQQQTLNDFENGVIVKIYKS